MDATAVASPDAAMYRDIQHLKSEVCVSCDGITRSYLDGMFGMHMLQAAERASSREKDPSSDSDSEEESFPVKSLPVPAQTSPGPDHLGQTPSSRKQRASEALQPSSLQQKAAKLSMQEIARK